MELAIEFLSDIKADNEGPISYVVELRGIGTGAKAGPFVFTSPISDKWMSELNWYFEEYWEWPVGPELRARPRT